MSSSRLYWRRRGGRPPVVLRSKIGMRRSPILGAIVFFLDSWCASCLWFLLMYSIKMLYQCWDRHHVHLSSRLPPMLLTSHEFKSHKVLDQLDMNLHMVPLHNLVILNIIEFFNKTYMLGLATYQLFWLHYLHYEDSLYNFTISCEGAFTLVLE